MLIRATSLVLKEVFFCTLSVLTRLVRLISTKTKEYFFGRHLCIQSIHLNNQVKLPLFKLQAAFFFPLHFMAWMQSTRANDELKWKKKVVITLSMD